MSRARFSAIFLAVLLHAPLARAEVILQWFETPYAEIEARMPEVALAGYSALWLPPPTKGADGVADVGFALFDRFDLGDRDQRGTVRTRYGTLAELQSMVRTAHRYGIRVYFDTVMNHNSNPSRVEFQGGPATPPNMLEYPGMTPLDFHVWPANPTGTPGEYNARRPSEFGGGTINVRPWQDNCPANTICEDDFIAAVAIADIPAEQLPPGGANHPALQGYTHLIRAPRMNFGGLAGQNWCAPQDRGNGCAYELLNASLLGLIDIANEQLADSSGPTSGDGTNLVTGTPLISYVRSADRPETYPSSSPTAEDSRQYLIRWIKWLSETTDADGFRLDAIRHTPESFFGEDYPGDPVAFDKVIQDSFDERRGYSDGNDDDLDGDAAIFGESFTGDIYGELNSYRRTGMRLLNFPLFFRLKGVFYSGADSGDGDMGQLSYPHGGQTGPLEEFGGLGRWDGVSFIQSHDECPPGTPVRNVPNCIPGENPQDDLAQAFITMRPGDSVVYFDGNNFTESTFVRAGRVDALGDFQDAIVKIVRATEDGARGGMFNRYVDDDAYVFERIVDGYGAAALVVLHDNIKPDGRVDGEGIAKFGGFDPRPLIVTSFPPGTVLMDLTGNAPVGSEVLTVLDPAVVSQGEKDNAYAAHTNANGGNTFVPPDHGLIYFGVRNGPVGNYLIYAPAGVSPQLEIVVGGSAAPSENVTTSQGKVTHVGANVPASQYARYQVPPSFTVRVPVTSTVGAVAGLTVDSAVPAGLSPLSATPEGAADGMGTMSTSGNAFEAQLSGLTAGEHLVKVRVVSDVAGAASRLVTLRALVRVEGVVNVDAGVRNDAAVDDDAGGQQTPDASVRDAGQRDAAIPDGNVVLPDGGTPPDSGAPADSGPAGDQDNDGVDDATDNCATEPNEDQTDFDGDGVGNVCDLCPATQGANLVDEDGCPQLPPDVRQELDELVEMVVGIRPENQALDQDLDGDLDAVDIARAVVRAQDRR
ncbi:MAG: alpha-amylase family glycosyl hydrolase [Myxococcota bacterium]